MALSSIRNSVGGDSARADVLRSMSEVFRLKKAAAFLVQVSARIPLMGPITRWIMLCASIAPVMMVGGSHFFPQMVDRFSGYMKWVVPTR